MLARVHREPEREWTVGSLAAAASMSRSAFAARFTELVGEPAMSYVTRWRMHAAVDALSGGDVTVADLAGRMGYRSEAAFSRAFSRVVGESPGAVRRRADRLVSAPLVPVAIRVNTPRSPLPVRRYRDVSENPDTAGYRRDRVRSDRLREYRVLARRVENPRSAMSPAGPRGSYP